MITSPQAPVLIGITGAHSDSGKTTLACLLLKHFAQSGTPWCALKCSPDAIYSSVIDDPVTLRREGKDTAKYLEAGAARAIWVRAPRHDLDEPLHMALGMLGETPGIIVEGNSAVELLNPDIVIYIFGDKARGKASSEVLFHRADVIVAHADDFTGEMPLRDRDVDVVSPDDADALIRTILRRLAHDK